MNKKVEEALQVLNDDWTNTSFEEYKDILIDYINFLEESVSMASGGAYDDLLDETFEEYLEEEEAKAND